MTGSSARDQVAIVGYGQSPGEAGQVQVDAALLDGYHADVHALTLRYLDGIASDGRRLTASTSSSGETPAGMSSRPHDRTHN